MARSRQRYESIDGASLAFGSIEAIVDDRVEVRSRWRAEWLDTSFNFSCTKPVLLLSTLVGISSVLACVLALGGLELLMSLIRSSGSGNPPTVSPSVLNKTTNSPSTPKPTGNPTSGGMATAKPISVEPRIFSSQYVNVVFTNPHSVPTRVQTVIVKAAAKWSAILKDTNLSNATFEEGLTFNSFGCSLDFDVALPNIPVTGMYMAAEITSIDGIGNTLGSAGPCAKVLPLLEDPEVLLPVVGRMRLDSADIGQLESKQILENVILHEIGHVLGLGTLWQETGLLEDAIFKNDAIPEPNNDPHFIGPAALGQYLALGGTQDKIPVEDGSYKRLQSLDIINGTGRGSIDGHWRERVFKNELMSPLLNRGSNPMSKITLGSLEDLGYAVDISLADAYALPIRTSRPDGMMLELETQSANLEGDIFYGPGMTAEIRNARSEARKRRRLGAP